MVVGTYQSHGSHALKLTLLYQNHHLQNQHHVVLKKTWNSWDFHTFQNIWNSDLNLLLWPFVVCLKYPTCDSRRLRAAVPVVHRVGVVRERLRGRDVGVGPVWFGCRGCRGWGMMEGWHGGATGGRHWAGGLHTCRLLLLIGTVADRKIKLLLNLTTSVTNW